MIFPTSCFLLLLFTHLLSLNMISHAFRVPSGGKSMIYSNCQRHLSKWIPKYHKTKLASQFTVNDLPSETLYILDGTAMLFHAYHSRESKTFEDAFFTPEFASQLLGKLSPAQCQTWEQFAQEQAANGALTNGNGDKVPNDHLRMSSAALTVMTSHFARFIREVRPTYLAVTFDVSRSTLKRTHLFPSYKKHRRRAPADLLPQFLVAPAIFQALGCHCLALKGYEADDLMASLSRWAREGSIAPVNIAIVSQDKDLQQLVDIGVHIVKPPMLEVTGPEEVKTKYGVSPKQLPDVFALAGDTADNIPGARGIGLKIAAKLITHFGDISNMYKMLGLSTLPPMKVDDNDVDDEEEVEDSKEISNTELSSRSPGSQGTIAKKKKAKSDQLSKEELLQHFSLQCAGNMIVAEEKLSQSLQTLQVAAIGRMSPIKILTSLARLGEENALLFRHLVTLEADVDWREALLPLQHKHTHINNSSSSNNTTTENKELNGDLEEFEFVSLLDLSPAGSNNNNNDENNSNNIDHNNNKHLDDNTEYVSFFRFTGESSVASTSKWLAGVSPSLLKPLSLLRQQYHHLR